MPNSEQPASVLPIASVEAVLAAAGDSESLTPQQKVAVSRWLTDEWLQAIRRARTKPLTKPDVIRLENAYRNFRDVIDSLQNRTLPPPCIPTSNGLTAWDDWRELYEQFGYVRGRRNSTDWILVGGLLALYEQISGKPASAAQSDGPTMRFLKLAFKELETQAPEDIRSNFSTLSSESVRRQLPDLNRLALRQAKRALDKLMGSAGA